MNDPVRQAERDVAFARQDLAADVAELKGWLCGVTPLMRFLHRAPKAARGRWARGGANRVDPLALLVLAVGAGWTLRRTIFRMENAGRGRR